MTENWDNFYDEIKERYKETDTSRQVYDHYERKLEILQDKKAEMAKNNKCFENTEFFQVLMRNEPKYMKAKEEYITKAVKTFDRIEELNVKRYAEVNPVLINVKLNQILDHKNGSENIWKF